MTELNNRIAELEQKLVRMQWIANHGILNDEEEARFARLYRELQELCPKYRGKRFWEGFTEPKNPKNPTPKVMPNLEKKMCRWCQTQPCIAGRNYCEYHASRVDNNECCEMCQGGRKVHF